MRARYEVKDAKKGRKLERRPDVGRQADGRELERWSCGERRREMTHFATQTWKLNIAAAHREACFPGTKLLAFSASKEDGEKG